MQVGMAQSSGRKRGGEMKVLIACEESQTVCKAFRALGHEAYSCDGIAKAMAEQWGGDVREET